MQDGELLSPESKRRAGSEKAFAFATEENESASSLQTPRATPRSLATLMSQSLRIEPATSANLSQRLGEPRDKLNAGRWRDTGRLGMIGRGSLWLVPCKAEGLRQARFALVLRQRTPKTLPERERWPGNSPRRSQATGRSRTSFTGNWTYRSERIIPESARGMRTSTSAPSARPLWSC